MAMLTRKGRALGSREHLVAESAAKTWKSFARIALRSAGVVTALSDLVGRGAVPCPAVASILPGLHWYRFGYNRPTTYPLFARALDIFGLRPRLHRRRRSNYFPAVFPVPQLPVP